MDARLTRVNSMTLAVQVYGHSGVLIWHRTNEGACDGKHSTFKWSLELSSTVSLVYANVMLYMFSLSPFHDILILHLRIIKGAINRR